MIKKKQQIFIWQKLQLASYWHFVGKQKSYEWADLFIKAPRHEHCSNTKLDWLESVEFCVHYILLLYFLFVTPHICVYYPFLSTSENLWKLCVWDGALCMTTREQANDVLVTVLPLVFNYNMRHLKVSSKSILHDTVWSRNLALYNLCSIYIKWTQPPTCCVD